MSIALILSLLDEEIARLEEAREILAGYIEPELAPVLPAAIVEAAAPAPQETAAAVTVFPPRVRRSRSSRSNPSPDTPNALHAPVPSGAVAVSATEAAKKRLSATPAAAPAPWRWTPARTHRAPTIDDLFGHTDPLVPTAKDAAIGAPGKLTPHTQTPPPR